MKHECRVPIRISITLDNHDPFPSNPHHHPVPYMQLSCISSTPLFKMNTLRLRTISMLARSRSFGEASGSAAPISVFTIPTSSKDSHPLCLRPFTCRFFEVLRRSLRIWAAAPIPVLTTIHSKDHHHSLLPTHSKTPLTFPPSACYSTGSYGLERFRLPAQPFPLFAFRGVAKAKSPCGTGKVVWDDGACVNG